MRTQADDLRRDIKDLEAQLMKSSHHSDIFTTVEIFKQLEIKKSILINIQ
jgi:hypothetical protein